MAVIRVNKSKNYTVMSNYHLREREMSLKAKGLLSLMLSLPNDWNYTIEGLVTICKENETAVKSTLNELKDFGYLEILKIQNQKGQFEYQYNIYEKPQSKKPEVENPGVENPSVENQGQLNTNKQNTKKEDIPSSKDEELRNHFELIWNIYPNKKGKAKALQLYFNWLKGRKINSIISKLTDEQMYYAVLAYKKECEDNKIDIQFIKHGDTFFNKAILDYVEENNE